MIYRAACVAMVYQAKLLSVPQQKDKWRFFLKNKSKKDIQKFENIGADIGLLFQVADDLIDYNGSPSAAGKKTGKDKKKGKATLISLLGDKNTIKYAKKLILKINTKLKKYGPKSKNLTETLNYILNRNK